MQVPNFTNNSLLMFHSDIKQALFIDDNLPDEKTKIYEVRNNPDFRMFADKLETELDKRQIVYPKINWDI